MHERIKNAENDPTYLEAPVKVLATLDCYNLNPQKVEHLIHAFLAKQRVNMTLISSKGLPYLNWAQGVRSRALRGSIQAQSRICL